MADLSEIEAAAKAAEADDPSGHARQWLLENHVATLCTTSTKRSVKGFPFGSVVPFALTPDGRPVILIANIATHTANLKADPRASLFVRQPGLEGDPQKGWRITLMGTWAPVESGPERDEIHARYVERVPFAEGYLATHDFGYWEMTEVAAKHGRNAALQELIERIHVFAAAPDHNAQDFGAALGATFTAYANFLADDGELALANQYLDILPKCSESADLRQRIAQTLARAHALAHANANANANARAPSTQYQQPTHQARQPRQQQPVTSRVPQPQPHYARQPQPQPQPHLCAQR
mgnify:CR=1 FL=1